MEIVCHHHDSSQALLGGTVEDSSRGAGPWRAPAMWNQLDTSSIGVFQCDNVFHAFPWIPWRCRGKSMAILTPDIGPEEITFPRSWPEMLMQPPFSWPTPWRRWVKLWPLWPEPRVIRSLGMPRLVHDGSEGIWNSMEFTYLQSFFDHVPLFAVIGSLFMPVFWKVSPTMPLNVADFPW